MPNAKTTKKPRRYPLIKSERDLGEVLEMRMKALGQDRAWVAEVCGMTKSMVDRAFGSNDVKADNAMLIGHVLGLSASFVCQLWMRDRLRKERDKQKVEPKGREDPMARDLRLLRHDRLDEKVQELERSIKWNSQAYVATGRKRRLALRKLRIAKKVSIESLASSSKDMPRKTDLVAYESGRVGLPPTALDHVLAELSLACGETVNLDELDRVARKLRDVHFVPDTTAWGVYPDRKPKHPSKVVFDPHSHEFKMGRSNTRLGPMTVDFLSVRQQTATTPGNLRILNSKHAGLELTILVLGKARFTVTTHKLPPEELDDRNFQPPSEEDGLVCDQVFMPGDVAIFDSGLYHRFECLSDEALVVSVNLGGSVDLARVMGPIVKKRRVQPPK